MSHPDKLFLGHRDIILGVVVSAEIAYSKEGNRKYILTKVNIGPTDQDVSATFSKMLYTSMVLREGLDSSDEAEAANVRLLVGRVFEIRSEHIASSIDGQTYLALRPVKEYR